MAPAGRISNGSTSRGRVADRGSFFEEAMKKYLEWYKTNRGAYAYLKYATPASKALKASFDGKRLSQLSHFQSRRTS
jgi:hypothetical protein